MSDMGVSAFGITDAEIAGSVCETGEITPDEVRDYDIVVVGAGASGVPAAGWAAELGAKTALLQKSHKVVSQGNCGSAIIKSRSTKAGIAKWIHHTNGLCDWRADTKQLKAYTEYSEEAMMWLFNRAGFTTETEYGDGSKVDSNTESAKLLKTDDGSGLCAFISTSGDFTGLWRDRENSYDYGDDHCYFWAPWIGPKPMNTGNALAKIVDKECRENGLEAFFSTPAVKLLTDGKRVTGVIGKNAEGKYIQFNASKAVILATGDYTNNPAMVKRWCPDIADFDKKQFGKTGDGHILAISAGAEMENLGHTKMMHDFDSALMWEEPFLYLNMEGERFTNEYTGFVYMGNLLKYQPSYKGNMLDANHKETGSKGWYCTIYDSDYVNWAKDEFVSGMVPPQVMEKFIPGAVENPQGVFKNLIDLHRCNTLEELAKELDIPFDKMKASVDRYNELCDKQYDEDFGKPAKYLHKIAKPPFWGARKHIRVSAEVSGVKTNENGQALHSDGTPIEGLYCVGNLGGPFYGGADYPFHQTGLSLGRCYTFGMIAARHALGKL